MLNPSFKPAAIEQGLLEAKQKYMAVFEIVLQTDKRKALVRSYESMADAQMIFDELCQDALRSTHFFIDSSRPLFYLTSVRIGDGHWNGIAQSFILHWQEQVHLYESLLDMAAHCSPEQKISILQNVVHPLQELSKASQESS